MEDATAAFDSVSQSIIHGNAAWGRIRTLDRCPNKLLSLFKTNAGRLLALAHQLDREIAALRPETGTHVVGSRLWDDVRKARTKLEAAHWRNLENNLSLIFQGPGISPDYLSRPAHNQQADNIRRRDLQRSAMIQSLRPSALLLLACVAPSTLFRASELEFNVVYDNIQQGADRWMRANEGRLYNATLRADLEPDARYRTFLTTLMTDLGMVAKTAVLPVQIAVAPEWEGPTAPAEYAADGPAATDSEAMVIHNRPVPQWKGPIGPARYVPDGVAATDSNAVEGPTAPAGYTPADGPAATDSEAMVIHNRPIPRWKGPIGPARYVPDGVAATDSHAGPSRTAPVDLWEQPARYAPVDGMAATHSNAVEGPTAPAGYAPDGMPATGSNAVARDAPVDWEGPTGPVGYALTSGMAVTGTNAVAIPYGPVNWEGPTAPAGYVLADGMAATGSTAVAHDALVSWEGPIGPAGYVLAGGTPATDANAVPHDMPVDWEGPIGPAALAHLGIGLGTDLGIDLGTDLSMDLNMDLGDLNMDLNMDQGMGLMDLGMAAPDAVVAIPGPVDRLEALTVGPQVLLAVLMEFAYARSRQLAARREPSEKVVIWSPYKLPYTPWIRIAGLTLVFDGDLDVLSVADRLQALGFVLIMRP